MKKLSYQVMRHVASLSLCVVVLAAGTASFLGGYQLEEPEM